MLSQRFLLCAALALNCFACAPRKSTDAESSAASVASGLPIVGTWVPDSYVGYFYTPSNERKKVMLEREQLRPEDWQIESDIDSTGNGYIKTKVDCKPNIDGSAKEMSGIPAPRSLGLFPDSLKLRTCDNGKKVEFHQSHTVLSVARNSVPRNMGVDGKAQSLLESCSQLRGYRFIKNHTAFNSMIGSTGCIGFADSSASRLSLLLVPMGEIHAVRIDFKRVR
jgi:hypothetical protein